LSSELGNAFDDYDSQLLKNAVRVRKSMIENDVDTSKLDYWLNKQ